MKVTAEIAELESSLKLQAVPFLVEINGLVLFVELVEGWLVSLEGNLALSWQACIKGAGRMPLALALTG